MLRLVLTLVLLAWPAAAHFTAGAKIRTLILAEDAAGFSLYLRSPAPLFFSDRIAAAGATGTPLTSPFLYAERTGAGLRYRLDRAAIAADEAAFRARLARAFRFAQGNASLVAEVAAWRLRLRDPGTGFDGVAAAEASLAGAPPGLDPVFGEAMIEVHYRIAADPAGTLRLDPDLPPLPLPPGVTLDTHMIDTRAK